MCRAHQTPACMQDRRAAGVGGDPRTYLLARVTGTDSACERMSRPSLAQSDSVGVAWEGADGEGCGASHVSTDIRAPHGCRDTRSSNRVSASGVHDRRRHPNSRRSRAAARRRDPYSQACAEVESVTSFAQETTSRSTAVHVVLSTRRLCRARTTTSWTWSQRC